MLYFGILQINNPDKTKFPIRGIDISRFQHRINWKTSKSEDVRSVFIKATEGGDYRDPVFSENWNKSNQAGFVRGAYHFFTFCRAGREQAQNFINTVPVEAGTLSPATELRLRELLRNNFALSHKQNAPPALPPFLGSKS